MLKSYLPRFIFLILLTTLVKGQLNQCKTVNEFNRDHSDHISSYFTFTSFLSRSIKENDVNDKVKFLGKGSFGNVFSVALKSPDSKVRIDAAVKVIKLKQKDRKFLNNELGVNQKIAHKYPLSFILYYGCVNDTKKNSNAFIFMEKMTCSLQSKRFIAISKTFSLPTKIGLMLLMAVAVKRLQDNNIGHFDIKPDNFMFLDSSPPLVKLIDFGMAQGKGFFGLRGTPDFLDPQMANPYYRSNFKSDVYSLGLTYYYILFGFEGMRMPNLKYLNNPMLMMYLNNHRAAIVNDNFNHKIRNIKMKIKSRISIK